MKRYLQGQLREVLIQIWIGSARFAAVLDTSFDRALVYATGGFAYGSVDNEITVFPTIPHTYRESGLETGYVLGGGLEYMVAPAWSIKAEYQYLNLGKSDPAYLGVTLERVFRNEGRGRRLSHRPGQASITTLAAHTSL